MSGSIERQSKEKENFQDLDSVQDILDSWESILEEKNITIPQDFESQACMYYLAKLLKVCIESGRKPLDAELYLDNQNIQSALQDFITHAYSYYQKYDYHGLESDPKKAQFIRAILRCLAGSLNNWERGLSIFIKGVLKGTKRAEKMINGKYNYPAGIDNEGYEFEWE